MTRYCQILKGSWLTSLNNKLLPRGCMFLRTLRMAVSGSFFNRADTILLSFLIIT